MQPLHHARVARHSRRSKPKRRALAYGALVLVPLLVVATALLLPSSNPTDPAARLTTGQLAGQRLIVGYPAGSPPRWLFRWIRRGQVAGVIVFTRNYHSRAQLRHDIRRLQRTRRPSGLRAPLLVMTDQEGGRVKRLPGPPRHSPADLGRIGSRSLAGDEGRATARNLRGLGFNLDLAPVMDLGRSLTAWFVENVRHPV